ncbi:6-phosphogluconolactonase, cycloisomerase 2 family [Chryseolinea serpens]|uniref:6-phosphogluconolactonase, cycloisomerase 2 family n=1 Tax=Chryseolinea serpens TaxID=947013 RepID=A0A1M5JPT9_9BACT|nr:beta-propeller fold lactonase family protein [Chryseolinea serpens]SHG42574.1 6-phosphogluconolactonase, cycloisomerase 2 family [Chryseolinea serpens]
MTFHFLAHWLRVALGVIPAMSRRCSFFAAHSGQSKIKALLVFALLGIAFLPATAQFLKFKYVNRGMQEGFEYVNALWISPDNKFAYTSSDAGLGVFDYNATTGAMVVNEIHYLEMYGFKEPTGIGNFVFSQDGRFVYASGETSTYMFIFTRDAVTGKLTYAGNFSATTKMYGGAPNMSISPDDKFLYLQQGAYVDIYKRNTVDGTVTQTAHVYTQGGGLYISNDGNYLYQASRYMHVYQRDQNTGGLTLVQQQPVSPALLGSGGMAVTPDEKYIFLGSSPSGIHRFQRNAANGFLTYLGTFSYPTPENKNNPTGPSSVMALDINPAGTRLYASAKGNGNVTSYAIGADGSLTLLDRKNSNRYFNGPFGLSLSNDGKFIYEFGSAEGDLTVKYFTENVNSKLDSVGLFRLGQSLHRGLTAMSSTAMSKDGQYVYTAGSSSIPLNSNERYFTSFRSGLSSGGVMEEINRVTFDSFGGTNITWVNEMAVSPDNKYLYANAGMSLLVFTLDASGAMQYQSQIQLAQAPRRMSLSADGKFLYVTADDNSLRTYSCGATGDLTLINSLTANIGAGVTDWLPVAIVQSPDSRFLTAVNEIDGYIFLVTFQRDATTGLLQFLRVTNLPTHYGYNGNLSFSLNDKTKMLYIVNKNNKDLHSYAWDPTTGAIGARVCSVNAVIDIQNSSVTPSGSYLILNSRYESEFYELRADGGIAYMGIQEKVGGASWSSGGTSELETFMLPANSNMVYACRSFDGIWIYQYEDKFPPATPQKVTATGGDKKITVSWEPAVTPGATYHVYRSTTDPYTASLATEIAQTTATTYVDTGTPVGVVAYYWVTATVSGSTSMFSLSAKAAAIDLPPAAPQNVTLQTGDKFLKVSWATNGESDLKNYTVYRGFINDPSSSGILATTTSTSYTDLTVDYDKVYYYWIVANDSQSASAKSLGVSGKAADGPPAVPSGINLATADKYITLTWNANSETDLAGYRIYKNTMPNAGTAVLYSSPTTTLLRRRPSGLWKGVLLLATGCRQNRPSKSLKSGLQRFARRFDPGHTYGARSYHRR